MPTLIGESKAGILRKLIFSGTLEQNLQVKKLTGGSIRQEGLMVSFPPDPMLADEVIERFGASPSQQVGFWLEKYLEKDQYLYIANTEGNLRDFLSYQPKVLMSTPFLARYPEIICNVADNPTVLCDWEMQSRWKEPYTKVDNLPMDNELLVVDWSWSINGGLQSIISRAKKVIVISNLNDLERDFLILNSMYPIRFPSRLQFLSRFGETSTSGKNNIYKGYREEAKELLQDLIFDVVDEEENLTIILPTRGKFLQLLKRYENTDFYPTIKVNPGLLSFDTNSPKSRTVEYVVRKLREEGKRIQVVGKNIQNLKTLANLVGSLHNVGRVFNYLPKELQETEATKDVIFCQEKQPGFFTTIYLEPTKQELSLPGVKILLDVEV